MEKTIAKVGYAPITETEDSITYANIKYFRSSEAGGREVSAEPNGDVATIYADGLPVIVADDNAGYNITLTLLSIVDDIDKDWYGNTVTKDGVLEVSNSDPRPRFALVIAKKRFNAPTKYAVDIYFYCSAKERVTRADKTSEGSFDPNFPAYAILSAPRPDNNYVRYTLYTDTLPETVVIPSKSEG